MSTDAPVGRTAGVDGSDIGDLEDGRIDLSQFRHRRLLAPSLGYSAPLDGLRAVALIGVLLYHSYFPWAAGGFLSLTAFFTLSGYLITSLLLREWTRDQSIDLRGFWRRRFRRLLPASWTVLGVVLVMGAAGVWNDDQLRSLRGDVPFALAEIVNWHFIAQDRSYGAEFAAPSPLTHFWSLAVEQQFYLLLPVLAFAALGLGRTRIARHRVAQLAVVFALLVVVSAVLNGVLARTSSIDRAYFGTDTRAAEMLMGGLLACLTLRRLRLPSQRMRNLAVAGGGVGALVTVWLWHSVTLSTMWLYPWGLLLAALCTCLVILAALQGRLFARALSFGPLVFLGRISYGVYLLHWPVFLWLSPARTGLAPWPLLALRLAVTLVLATLLFRLIEDPVRRGVRLAPNIGRSVSVAGLSVVALVAGTLVVTSDLGAPSQLSLASAESAEDTPPPPPPIPALVVGDEVAQSLGEALEADDDWEATLATAPTCGLALGGWIATAGGPVERDTDRCLGAQELVKAAVRSGDADTVLLMPGMRDAATRSLAANSGWAGPGDPGIDEFLRSGFGLLIDELSDSDAQLVAVTMPPVRNTVAPTPAPLNPPIGEGPDAVAMLHALQATMQQSAPPAAFAENDDTRVARINEILVEVAESRGMPVIDLAAHMASLPGGALDPQLRPDGVTISADGGAQVAEWLAEQVRTAAPRAEAPAVSGVVDVDAPLPPAPQLGPRRSVGADEQLDVVVVGDSVAHNLGYGLIQWQDGGANARIVNAAQLGCPVARGGSYRFKGDISEFAATCEWNERFADLVQNQRPDVVLLASGVWEVVDRKLIGDDRFRRIGDPSVDRFLLGELITAIDSLSVDGATVVLVLQPTMRPGLDQGYQGLPESDPARIERWNELLREAAGERPAVTQLVDLRSWLAAQPGGEDNADVRPDGVHFTDDYVSTIGAWLGPELRRIAESPAL